MHLSQILFFLDREGLLSNSSMNFKGILEGWLDGLKYIEKMSSSFDMKDSIGLQFCSKNVHFKFKLSLNYIPLPSWKSCPMAWKQKLRQQTWNHSQKKLGSDIDRQL